MSAARPYTLKRFISGDQAEYLVLDADTKERVGVVFKYLGFWWPGSAENLKDQCASKERAADLLWERKRG